TGPDAAEHRVHPGQGGEGEITGVIVRERVPEAQHHAETHGERQQRKENFTELHCASIGREAPRGRAYSYLRLPEKARILISLRRSMVIIPSGSSISFSTRPPGIRSALSRFAGLPIAQTVNGPERRASLTRMLAPAQRAALLTITRCGLLRSAQEIAIASVTSSFSLLRRECEVGPLLN